MKNITLIGMPGSGKSTVGVLLAKTLGFGFIDTDLVIQTREGALLQEVVDSHTNDEFLDIEADVICSVDCDRTVIAPGGSVICRARGIEHLRALGKVVYLKVPCEALEQRIQNMGSRGIAFKPGETLRDIYEYRAPLYEKYADIVVDGDKGSLEETLSAVLQALIGC
ncbi:shikimate kinase [Pseudoflavonifractor sp. MSJ-37]|uniref:shikimate kinase n=1 Tax=Pseudoflavonifractor sp. MSJ-37 TaxID=2841531 RepID=UPI001C129624|nr:shikimate kinase [Pseudoflavonifractor sp. MSJ-37]MBU5435282.1 shikimate kinase [Pseudoflavonifractor sp. MSJ-37]